ncbi:DUF748 domain-containing protein [Marinobacter bohaiensis]|uniref:DUF748 domain-containing protein n=1 Tax=Marinobacter bohaiensis TaxID=2201898 RepID=UPI000DAD09C2|nr:DUF748 domain-containing protein [Marinobacter bohaiensis]
MAESQARKPVYKWVSFWLALVVLLYLLAGFIGLPWWLQKTIPEQLASQLGWQGQVSDVDFNPLTMTLDVEGLDAEDGQGEKVVAAQHIHVNLTVWQLVTGTVAFESIRLESPFVRVDLLKDYGVNLARDWSEHHTDTAAEEAPTDDAGEPPRLYFGEIQLVDGHIRFRDYSQGREETFDITPLDLSLNDLATYNSEGDASDYNLTAAINDQQIQWTGNIGVMPFHSNGRLELNNIAHSTLWHFASPYAPYLVNEGELSLSTDYAVSSAGEFALVTSNGELQIRDISTSLPDAEAPFATLKTLKVSDIGFNLADRSLTVGAVDLDGLQGDIQRDADGAINLLKPFAGADDATSEAEAATASGDTDTTPFRWRIDQVHLQNSSIRWQDNALATPANLQAGNIDIQMGPLTQALEEPVPYEATMTLNDGGSVEARGQTTPVPFTLETVLSLDQIALAPFQPYVQESADVAFAGGTLRAEGNLDLDAQDPPLTGTFSGNGQVQNLALTRAGDGDPLLSWSSLLLNPIEYNLEPARLEIGTITLTGPDANIIRKADGSTNLDGLMKGDDAQAERSEPDASGDDEQGFIFRVGSIQLENGQFDLADRTVEPVFTTRMREMNGLIEGLSNISPQQGSVKLGGQLGERGQVDVSGSIGTLGQEDTSHLELKLDNMAMAELSPYFGRFVGYAVDSGKLRMDLNYDITGPRIKAENRIVMDQLALGQSVDSEDAVQAPVKLGLTLLTDTDGIIDINLPIEGNLEDPEFRVGQVVMRAFVNLLAKAATSPFSMLGSMAELAGLSGDELGQVAFVPGEATLGADEDKKLEVLANALSERPELLLNVRGAVDPDLDGVALKSERMNRRLNLTTDTPREQRVKALEAEYASDNGQSALTALQQEHGETGEDRHNSPEWVAILTRELTQSVELPPEALERLAKARGTLLQQRLSQEYGIPNDQLFLQAPSQDAQTDMGEDAIRVIVPFSMEAR